MLDRDPEENLVSWKVNQHFLVTEVSIIIVNLWNWRTGTRATVDVTSEVN